MRRIARDEIFKYTFEYIESCSFNISLTKDSSNNDYDIISIST